MLSLCDQSFLQLGPENPALHAQVPSVLHVPLPLHVVLATHWVQPIPLG